MAHALTLELPDDMYDAVQKVARRCGKAPEAVALEGVARHVAASAGLAGGEVDTADAWAKLLRHAGAVSGGNHTRPTQNGSMPIWRGNTRQSENHAGAAGDCGSVVAE